MDLLNWDWGGSMRMMVSAGVATAAVQVLMPMYRDRRARKKHAAYMAVRLAVTLESFSWSCANLLQDNHNAETPPDHEHPNWNHELPELAPYPDDSDGWRAIDSKLVGRVLGFRNKLHETKSTIRNVIEFNEGALSWTLDEEAASRGLEAWRLGSDLRKTHSLEAVELEWDYPDFLQRQLDAAVTKKEEDRVRRRKLAAN